MRNTTSPLIPALVACAIAVTACGITTDRPAGGPVSVFADPALERWTLADTPHLQIGGSDERDGYALGSFAGAALLRDRLVIADGMAKELRYYSLSGELLRRSGREGGGPGEFRSIRALRVYDDSTVVVWDQMLRRFTLLRPGRCRTCRDRGGPRRCTERGADLRRGAG